MNKSRLLLVDSEEDIRTTVGELLRMEGYDVDIVATGAAVLTALEEQCYDLVVLDINLPDCEGMQVVNAIIERSPDTKIIFLTAHGSLESAIEALRVGAHDYLLKPADSHKLLNSVASAIARRKEQVERRMLLEQIESSIQRLKDSESVETSKYVSSQAINLTSWVTFDVPRRELWSGNQRARLTPTETKLLQVLAENRGRVLSHRELVMMVQGYDSNELEAPEVLRPLISRLRSKMARFNDGANWIISVRGTGYLFDPAVAEA
jgi:DNA-binding response OmpR family regulator